MSDKQLQQAFLQYLYKVSGAKTEEEFQQFIQQIGKEGIQKYQQQFMAALQQQQAQKAAHGAKLDYITRLNNGNCAADEEPAYFKIGGKFCRKCKKKQEEGGAIPYTPIQEPQSVVEKFKSAKCGAKMKKKKCEDGGEVDMAKCGKKVKKGQEGLELLGRAAGRMGGLFINPVFHGALAGGIPEEMKVPKTRYRDTGVNQSLDYPSGRVYMHRLLNRMSPDTIYYKDNVEYTKENPNYRSIANQFDRALMKASALYPDQQSLNYEKSRIRKKSTR